MEINRKECESILIKVCMRPPFHRTSSKGTFLELALGFDVFVFREKEEWRESYIYIAMENSFLCLMTKVMSISPKI